MKLKESIVLALDIAESNRCNTCLQVGALDNMDIKALKTLISIAEKVLEIGGKMPAHIGIAGIDDSIWNDSYNLAIDRCTLATAGMLAEKDKKIAELQDENGRLCHGACAIQDEISIYKKKIAELASLCDGASIAVELFNATTPAQVEWKESWLRKFREEK